MCRNGLIAPAFNEAGMRPKTQILRGKRRMNKNELIEAIASGAGTTKAAAGKMLAAFIGAVTDELKVGGQIVLPGFVTIKVGNRAARMGRNPKTGEVIKIAAARVAQFKAGKQLKEAVQEEK